MDIIWFVWTDGGDTSQINENGYRKSHSSHWQRHDYAWWSQYLQSKKGYDAWNV